MSDKPDWWDRLLAHRAEEGREDAEKGCYDFPYQGSDDPQDQDENNAYQRGFNERRKELGDKFKWA